MGGKISISNKTKSKLPNLSLTAAKNDILGKQYFLSIAYVSQKKSQEINKKYRKQNRATNILSFSLRKNEGELVLCPDVGKREAKIFGENFRQFLSRLFIHGMLHLKGMRHGKAMEKAEKKFLSRVKF